MRPSKRGQFLKRREQGHIIHEILVDPRDGYLNYPTMQTKIAGASRAQRTL